MKGMEESYQKYMAEGGPDKQGKDFCDMSKPFNTPRENYSVINAMLPSRYYPEFQGNIFERVAANLAAQLFPDVEMVTFLDSKNINDREHSRFSTMISYWISGQVLMTLSSLGIKIWHIGQTPK
jgi:hypothetical protein